MLSVLPAPDSPLMTMHWFCLVKARGRKSTTYFAGLLITLLLASFHHLIAVVSDSEDVRRELANLLVSVELDLFCVVDGEDLIGIYSHQDRSSVGLQRVVMKSVRCEAHQNIQISLT